MQLFYNPDLKSDTASFSFDKEESRHIIKVLRKKEGDILFVTNGLGLLFTTEITDARESKCTVSIASSEAFGERKPHLHLAVAPTKMNERYEWFLEKATEIGVTEITPVICEHSERKNIKSERFEKILVSAMKQSKQYFLPKLNPAVSLSDFLKAKRDGQLFIAHCEENDKNSLKQSLSPGTDVTLLIGPEGDFSSKEIKTALDNGYLPVSLGDTRLRTETAAIVACHTVILLNE